MTDQNHRLPKLTQDDAGNDGYEHDNWRGIERPCIFILQRRIPDQPCEVAILEQVPVTEQQCNHHFSESLRDGKCDTSPQLANGGTKPAPKGCV